MPAPSPRGNISNRRGAAPFRSRPNGMKDKTAEQILGRLDRALPATETSTAQMVAAILALEPGLSDAEIVRRVAGLDDPAEVARVRGRMAAGRDPDSPPDRPHEPESDSHAAPRAAPPTTGKQPVAAVVPTFVVHAADGSTHRVDRYRHAMILKACLGGTLSVET